MHDPTPAEIQQRDAVLDTLLSAIKASTPLKLPAFDRESSSPSDFALLSVARQSNPLAGSIGEFLYQFEGEEDLLHLFVVRANGRPLAVEDAQRVAEFVLPGVSPSFLFLKPGELSHHFYLGHDILLEVFPSQGG